MGGEAHEINDDTAYIVKDDIDRLYEAINTGVFPPRHNFFDAGAAIDDAPPDSEHNGTKINGTAKQFSMIAFLLELLGFSSTDLRSGLSGSEINNRLGQLAARKGIEHITVDKNTWTDWLNRAGKR
ncbi:hypothetical protein H4F49_09885 [Pectobacterium polaris]|nr:hypothetical protein [Pectobacterium polaris]MBN3080950.1 hypothetical protein [Pectobacterium polaris]